MKSLIADKLKAGALLLDVRTPQEFLEEAFPGAKNIPVNVLPQRVNEVGPKEHPVVIYCASGGRSAVARQILQAQGWKDVTDAGGLRDLQAALR